MTEIRNVLNQYDEIWNKNSDAVKSLVNATYHCKLTIEQADGIAKDLPDFAKFFDEPDAGYPSFVPCTECGEYYAPIQNMDRYDNTVGCQRCEHRYLRRERADTRAQIRSRGVRV